MKKFLAACLVATATLSISACSGTPPPAPTTTHSVNAESEFRTLIEQHTNLNPDSAEELAKTACTAMDRGMSVRQIALTMIQSMDPNDAGYVIGAGTLAFCPEHQPEVDAFRSSTN